MLREWWLPWCLLLLGSAGYLVASWLTFAAPVALPASMSSAASDGTLESNDCGLFPTDFTAAGGLPLTPGQAWWLSVGRKQEYFSALPMGFVMAFVGFAIRKIRQTGAGMTSGLCAGSGVLALLTLCLGCLAPTLSAIGLGLFANLGLAQYLPKWLLTLNTVGLSLWGMVFIARRARACPLQNATGGQSVLTRAVNTDLASMEQT